MGADAARRRAGSRRRDRAEAPDWQLPWQLVQPRSKLDVDHAIHVAFAIDDADVVLGDDSGVAARTIRDLRMRSGGGAP